MQIQKSYKGNESLGKLYLVSTPIGNLADITYRAIEVLQQVDLIAAEDTRQTIKLLNHFNIHKKLVSYHEHNKEISGHELISRIKEGQTIALVSDAGMPAISDPGYELVKASIEQGIAVIPIPGANAALLGLVASGLPTARFVFIGFLPREKKALINELNHFNAYQETLILYEAPHRIGKTLAIIKDILGNRNMVLIRELTKKHEEFIRGSVADVSNYVDKTEIKGELTIIIEGANEAEVKINNWWENMSIKEHVEYYIVQGKIVKEAIKITATDRKLPKREIYQIYHGI